MGDAKLMSMSEAVKRFIPDGASVAMGLCYESLIPFGAGHEMIRQKKKGLRLLGPISDILFDQMIGAGSVSSVCAAWVGNVITGSGYNFRRGIESGVLEVEDHSNYTISLALQAGAMGVPFLPTKTALGSDLFKTNPGLTTFNCPITGTRLTAVKAICPDVAVVHLQRSDIHGNSHLWGNSGITREACLASNAIIVTAEEIVPSEEITSDPGRVIFPGFRVSAVVHLPWGGHPSPVPGFYNRDHGAFLAYREATRTPARAQEWLSTWVHGVADRQDYLSLVTRERLDALGISKHLFSKRVDHGY